MWGLIIFCIIWNTRRKWSRRVHDRRIHTPGLCTVECDRTYISGLYTHLCAAQLQLLMDPKFPTRHGIQFKKNRIGIISEDFNSTYIICMQSENSLKHKHYLMIVDLL